MSVGEKIYKTMNCTGAWSIAMGIIALIAGISIGIGCIVSGSVLLKRKSQVTF